MKYDYVENNRTKRYSEQTETPKRKSDIVIAVLDKFRFDVTVLVNWFRDSVFFNGVKLRKNGVKFRGEKNTELKKRS